MPTLGLALITNDANKTEELIKKYTPYFDKFYITVADKDKTELAILRTVDDSKVELSFFKWIDHFGKARLFNQSQIKTDYWLWMDDDDDITKPQNLRAVVDGMETNKVDIMFMNYDYYANEFGEQQANHWRERIIRTKSECKWEDVPCHETVPAKGRADRTDLVSVKHNKSIEHMLFSMDRNQKLLEKDWKTNKDPRTAYYLGMTYQYHQQFEKAISKFSFLVDKGGWDEQKVVALNYLSNCYFFLKEYDKALNAIDKAIELDPSHPDAYYQKVLVYSTKGEYAKAAEWADMAVTKKTDPNSMQLIDPTKYTYRGLFLAAQANLFVGKPDKAFGQYNEIMAVAPHYIEEMNKVSNVDWGRTFAEGMNEFNAVNSVRFLTDYLRERGGKIDKLFESLPPKISYDARLARERQLAIPPHKWSEKSIVIYCGRGFEPWGPDTLDRGMGGSEEAVIYLSRELAELGWSITVFCERESEYDDFHWDYVTYKPWSEFSPYDEFDVYIAWRRPEFVDGVKARKKILDLHDTMPEETILPLLDQIDTIMVKSPYHRSLYPNIPDDKINIITNGIYEKLAY